MKDQFPDFRESNIVGRIAYLESTVMAACLQLFDPSSFLISLLLGCQVESGVESGLHPLAYRIPPNPLNILVDCII